MKKCLSLLLAALMLAAVLTGCGGNPSTEETDTPAYTGTSGSLGSGGCQLGSLGSSPPFGSSGSVTAADVWTGHPPGLVSVGATAFSRVLMR